MSFWKKKLPVVKNLSFESEFKLSHPGPFYSAIVKTVNLFVFILVNFNMTSNLAKVINNVEKYKAFHFQTISFLLIKPDNSREQHESVAKSALQNLSTFLSEMLNVNKQQWVENYKQLDRHNRKKIKTANNLAPEPKVCPSLLFVHVSDCTHRKLSGEQRLFHSLIQFNDCL